VVGSIAELKEMGLDVPEDIELHKPYIDRVFLRCPECQKGKMQRVPEVIDCWFDSGSMPFAQWHYPFENQELFHENFPADFISEAVDQTRGWFYTLLAISTLLFDQPSYKNVIVLGHVLDKDGQKMSKHKGNVVDPWVVLDKLGADAVRWYFYTSSAPWLPSRFYEEAVSESQRRFMATLWNTYAFFVLYANIDKFNPTQYSLDYDKLSVMDRWILSRLHSLTAFVDDNLNRYRITEAARGIQDFVDELSNWYVRRSRERFWQKEMPQDKINAYMTLYTVLVELAKLAAPFVPFMTEEIYDNLVRSIQPDAPESVHLCDYPRSDASWIDEELEKNMDVVLKLVTMGRACRNTANIKIRQPLKTMYVKLGQTLPDMFVELVKDELNVKELVFTEDIDDFTVVTIKPQLKTLGPRYGRLLPKLTQALRELDGKKALQTFRNGQPVRLTVEDRTIELAEEDVLIETGHREGFVVESNRDITVALDTNLTEELVEEGFVREIVSKVQNMRKEAGFEVQDRIHLYYFDNDRIGRIIERNKEEIAEEVLATQIAEGKADGYTKEWNINDERVTLTVVRK
jgi:isoleucyl-tRNA synthetase